MFLNIKLTTFVFIVAVKICTNSENILIFRAKTFGSILQLYDSENCTVCFDSYYWCI